MASITFSSTIEGGLFVDTGAIETQIRQAMRGPIKSDLVKAFDKRVANWRDRVSFRDKLASGVSDITLTIFPSGSKEAMDKYKWTSAGTSPHIIRPVNAPFLAFNTNYVPKTTKAGSFGGPGVATGPRVISKGVSHPGTEAREFPEKVADEQESFVFSELEKAFNTGLRQ